MADSEQRGLLGDDSPKSIPSTATVSPAQHFAARHRPGYARVPSVSFTDEPTVRGIPGNSAEDEISHSTDNDGRRHGLGIHGISSPTASSSKARRVSSPLAQPESASYSRYVAAERTPVMSPPSTGGFSGSTRYDASFSSDLDTSYAGAKAKDSRTSLQSASAASLYAKSDAGLLSSRSRYDFEPHHCQSVKDIKHGRFHSWLSIGIIALAMFSTAFSAVFLILALKGPKYGKAIREHGGALTPSSAAFLTSFFAKLIELAFVTVVVAFVGQALSRRAFKDKVAQGVTLAEMNMRTWVMQPGTMFTNWESVRYAGVSFLGLISLTAALMALLYTTAATALVQPQLKWPDWQPRVMQGLVKTSFANGVQIEKNCITPNVILYTSDTEAGPTCLQMSHAAQSYHNYWTYSQNWAKVVNNGTGSVPLARRPQGYALFNDNTTIVAPWIEQQNVTVYNQSRYINNITMAMPHLGIVQAAMDPVNKLVQPGEFEGAELDIVASVPSPILNVLCVTLAKEDLKPFIYNLWDEKSYPRIKNFTAWPHNFDSSPDDPYTKDTEFDHIFGWGSAYGSSRTRPVFPKLPEDMNTLLNDSVGMSWGRTAIYVLGKGGPTSFDGIPTPDNYALCQLQAGWTGSCSTHYNVSVSGAQMEAVCEDKNDMLQYYRSMADAWSGNATLSADWPNVAGDWARSISLKDGITNGDSSNNHQLTQLIVTSQNLSTGLPSMAEALAVMAASTLIDSVVGTTFVGHSWNYTINALDPGQHEYFNASVRALQYASGGSMPYQKAFYVVLWGLFVMSLLILIYFGWHGDWYSDFSEPATMFALTLNSPPSEKLAGSCGCGPTGTQYKVPWRLRDDGGHYFVDAQDQLSDPISVSSSRLSRRTWTEFDLLNLRGRLSPKPVQEPVQSGGV